MKLKETYVLLIFIFTFIAFLFLINPQYTGYVIQEEIDTLQSLQEDSETLEIIEALDMDISPAIAALKDYDLQVQTIEQDTTLNDTEKENLTLNLEMQADDLLAELPKLLVITNKISGLPATPITDITLEMLPEGMDSSMIEEVLYFQEQVEARTDIKVFTMLTFLGDEISGTYIKKTINAPIQNGYILEIIPIVTSEEDIYFLGEYEVIDYDPLTLSIEMSGGAALYSYVILEDVFTLIDKIQTAAVPYEVEIEQVIEVKCGDGICTEYLEDEIICPEDCARKLPWLFILSIVIVLVVGVLFFHFFRHRIKALFKKEETLFKSESDKENLKNYIKTSLNEGINEEQIKSILLAKDWTEKQINFIMNEIREEAKSEEESVEKESKSEESQEEAI